MKKNSRKLDHDMKMLSQEVFINRKWNTKKWKVKQQEEATQDGIA